MQNRASDELVRDTAPCELSLARFRILPPSLVEAGRGTGQVQPQAHFELSAVDIWQIALDEYSRLLKDLLYARAIFDPVAKRQ